MRTVAMLVLAGAAQIASAQHVPPLDVTLPDGNVVRLAPGATGSASVLVRNNTATARTAVIGLLGVALAGAAEYTITPRPGDCPLSTAPQLPGIRTPPLAAGAVHRCTFDVTRNAASRNDVIARLLADADYVGVSLYFGDVVDRGIALAPVQAIGPADTSGVVQVIASNLDATRRADVVARTCLPGSTTIDPALPGGCDAVQGEGCYVNAPPEPGLHYVHFRFRDLAPRETRTCVFRLATDAPLASRPGTFALSIDDQDLTDVPLTYVDTADPNPANDRAALGPFPLVREVPIGRFALAALAFALLLAAAFGRRPYPAGA